MERLQLQLVVREHCPEAEQTVDLRHWFLCFSADIVSRFVLGTSLDCLDRVSRIFYWASLFDCLDSLGLTNIFQRALRLFFSEKNAKLQASRDEAILGSMEHLDTNRLDAVAAAVRQLDPSPQMKNELLGHVQSILLGGTDPMTTALTSIVHYTLQSPQTHAKLKAEIRSSLTSFDSLTVQQANDLPYLNAVIKETLRIYPPVATVLPRKSPGAVVDGTYIPPDVHVSSCMLAIHHNPTYFSEPDKFIPERWLDGGTGDNLEASQPFSIGPRGCIGKHLATFSLQYTVIALFLKFDMQCNEAPCDWPKRNKNYSTWITPSLYVSLRERKPHF
ncbi:cytochrome P450 [Rhizodiscina lignyota]|uniref:Cytochrome P450 n=1 Tax=Rhizodiscina lignyota TaxID=1504668 RepID=A0A9P4M5R0_9PEZI|nr:cytochrome P450 [Rhizodiscina lignyota]